MHLPITPIVRAQWFFLVVPIIFVLFSIVSIVNQSQGRRSIIAVQDVDLSASAMFSSLGQVGEVGTRLQIKDFHRVEIKEGQKVWEIRANDASYFAKDLVSHVNEAKVVVYRSDNSAVHISSSAAKLFTNAETLDRAELEGAVDVRFDDSLRLKTELAIYDSVRGRIRAPGYAEISGQGYFVEGIGLEIEIETQRIELTDQVRSRFEENARVPTPFAEGLSR